MRSIPRFAKCCLIALAAAFAQRTASSQTGDSDLCLQAARSAAEESGVPLEVLLAISLVETGRNGKSWPWTVNIDGQPHWPETLADSVRLVEAALATGVTNVDIGCFQLNLHWHSKGFQSVEDMFDPPRNAGYAARLLARNHEETGDWSLAAARYHSSTQEYADLYQAKFDIALSSLIGEETEFAMSSESSVNGFPLLAGGPSGSSGSLVPYRSGGLPLIGGP